VKSLKTPNLLNAFSALFFFLLFKSLSNKPYLYSARSNIIIVDQVRGGGMPFTRNNFLLGFVIIAALVIIAGTLGAARDVITKNEIPDFSNDIEVLNWLSAHSEEILRNIRSHKPLLEEVKGYPKCVVKDAARHYGDLWTVNKLDISAFCIHRSAEGELLEAWVIVYVYNENGEPTKLVHVKINPHTFEVIGIETVEDIILQTHTHPPIILNEEEP